MPTSANYNRVSATRRPGSPMSSAQSQPLRCSGALMQAAQTDACQRQPRDSRDSPARVPHAKQTSPAGGSENPLSYWDDRKH